MHEGGNLIRDWQGNFFKEIDAMNICELKIGLFLKDSDKKIMVEINTDRHRVYLFNPPLKFLHATRCWWMWEWKRFWGNYSFALLNATSCKSFVSFFILRYLNLKRKIFKEWKIDFISSKIKGIDKENRNDFITYNIYFF